MRQPEDEPPELSKWDIDEFMGRHIRPPEPEKGWYQRVFDRTGGNEIWPIALIYIGILCAAAYSIARLFT